MSISASNAKRILQAVAPRFRGKPAAAQAEIIDAIAGDLAEVLREYEINTPLRQAHFLAQIAHESAGLRTTEEFASGQAYEGRRDLGNVNAGDGRRYKGRGLLQLTGRANYRRLGAKLGIALEDNPELAAEPKLSLTIACEYWIDHKINANCDADDLVAVTRKVNGGRNGLADRRHYLALAKQALAQAEKEGAPLAETAAEPVAKGAVKPVSLIATAYRSGTTWAQVWAIIVMIFGFLTDWAKQAWEYVMWAVGIVPEIYAEAKEGLSSAQEMAQWFGLNIKTISLAVAAVCIGVAIIRHLRDKRTIVTQQVQQAQEPTT